ncbi:MAG TPA: hypothetical protein VFN11_03025 [Ktedonobacterales bacterium]|nr:hypothetical protein [Ktedonobacterales bacterium]
MFQDPNHPDLQTLADHHDAGTHDQIPADQAAAALAAFQQNADPALVQQLVAQHYANMTPEQLQAAAQSLQQKAAAAAPDSEHAAMDPATATAEQVAAAHHTVFSEHPHVARDVAIGGAVVGAGALAALAARHYLRSRGS